MEAELLRSKTELMVLNNHLLEAVQKRLELSLELEAWKVRTNATTPPRKVTRPSRQQPRCVDVNMRTRS